MRCPNCQTLNPAEANFCHQCGTRLAIVCPGCSYRNVPEARFCNNCGIRLTVLDIPASPSVWPGRPLEVVQQSGTGDFYSREDERRPLTILFADLVGFTALADRLDPEEVREITAITLGRLAREITTYGGTVDKYLGDGVLALFGAPVAHEDDAARGVGAALAMHAAMGELNETLGAAGGGELALRVGINTGLVVVGAREVGGRREYTAVGDPVNVASRLQSVAQPGTILVGEATFRAASRGFRFKELPPLELRGKSEPVSAYQVLGPLEWGRGAWTPASGSFESPLVGREQHLASLRYCFDQLLRGRGQIAFVLGEAGLGKSRLVAELREAYSGRSLEWAQARAFSYGQHLSYGVFNGTIRDLFPPEEHGGQPEAGTALRAYLEDLAAVGAYPFVALQLGLPVDHVVQAALDRLTPQEFQARLVAAMSCFLTGLATRRPLVFVVDDLHWADPSSMGLLDGLLDLVDRVPILFCFLMRPERDSAAWQLKEHAARDFPHRYTEVNLRPLEQDESRVLLENLVHTPASLAGLNDLILTKTEGNPLFIEEVVRDLLERGALVRTAQGLEAVRSVEEVHLPDSVQSAMMARVDRLREPVRQTLQTAAVIGRVFPHAVLSSVLGEQAGLDDCLREAQRAELIVEVAVQPERVYAFRHPLVQEAVYQTLLVRRRRELHGAVAVVLESLYSARLDEHYEVLAHHYAEAENWDRALQYAWLEGDRAALAHANREALTHYRLALRAASHDGVALDRTAAADLFERTADVLTRIGLTDEAVEHYREALARHCASDGKSVASGRLCVKLARVALYLQDPHAADGYLEAAFSALPEHQPELSSAWTIRSRLQVWRNEYQAALESARKALRLARRAGLSGQMDEAYSALTQTSLAGLPGHDIIARTKEWVAAARERDERYGLHSALSVSVVNQLWAFGHVDARVLAMAREALALAEDLDADAEAQAGRILVGGCLFLQGQWTEAEQMLGAVRSIEQRAGPAEELGIFWLSLLYTAQGRFEPARALLDQALNALGFPHSRIWLNQALARNHAAVDDRDGTAIALLRGAEAAERLACLPCAAHFYGDAAELWAQFGRIERAEPLARRADELARRLRRRPTLLAVERTRAALLSLGGDWDASTLRLRLALRLARGLGQPYEVARTALQLGLAYARLDGAGDRERGPSQIRTAMQIFQSLGAEADRRRAEAAVADLDRIPVPVGRGA